MLLYEDLLFSLKSLQPHLLLGDQLDGELAGLFDYPLVFLLLGLAHCGAFDQVVEDDAAGIDVLGFQQLVSYLDLAHDDRMDV